MRSDRGESDRRRPYKHFASKQALTFAVYYSEFYTRLWGDDPGDRLVRLLGHGLLSAVRGKGMD